MCVPDPNKNQVTLVLMHFKMYLLEYSTTSRYFLDSVKPGVICSTCFVVASLKFILIPSKPEPIEFDDDPHQRNIRRKSN